MRFVWTIDNVGDRGGCLVWSILLGRDDGKSGLETDVVLVYDTVGGSGSLTGRLAGKGSLRSTGSMKTRCAHD